MYPFGEFGLRFPFQILSQYGPNLADVSSWPVIGQFSSIGSLGNTTDNWLCGEWLNSLAACRISQNLLKKPKLHLVSTFLITESLTAFSV
jgi:hypothetical protein